MSTKTTIADLRSLRTRFDRHAARRKLRLLERIGGDLAMDAADCLNLHETLLFICAYPDSRAVLSAAEAGLRRLGDALKRGDFEFPRAKLADTGIENTESICSLSHEATRWLAARFPNAVDVTWNDGHDHDALDALLALVLEPVEGDSLLHEALDAPEWIDAARGDRTSLQWLLDRVSELHTSDAIRERLFDACGLHVRWRLSGRSLSRTHARFPRRSIHYQTGPIDRSADLGAIIARPLPAVRRLPVGEAKTLIDTARGVLAVRHRETDPVTYANPHEVTLVALEDGIDVALFGMRPERRQPIESFFGYIVARNRVPLGYGGGWVFFDRCEIGVNIFDTFRGGANAAIFANILRVYHHHYGARRFAVDPFQFGADNPEAIRSGAFWFYYRLGFRPTDAGALRLANRHWERLAADKRYRTPRPTLRRLARSPLEYQIAATTPVPDVCELGLSVTRWIAGEFDGNREAARKAAVANVRKALRVRGMESWPPDERRAFETMSLLIGQIKDLRTWKPSQRQALVSVMRAKGARRERTYATRLKRLAPLRSALIRLAETAK